MEACGGRWDVYGLRRFALFAVCGHVSEFGEVRVLISKTRRFPRFQQADVLDAFLDVLPYTSLKIKETILKHLMQCLLSSTPS